MEALNIFVYLDFRVFLSDWFDAKKKENPRYSHRMFVRQTGQKSPSYLADVIKGRRRLTPETATAVCKVMKLSSAHRRYFLLLVDFERAEDDGEKERAWREISMIRRMRLAKTLEGDTFEILSQWQHSAIHQLARRSDFRLDPQWIGRNLAPPISPGLAKKAVETLFGAGLLRTGEQGQIEAVDVDLVTPDRVLGLAVRNYHRGMLGLAQEAMSRFPDRRRYYRGVTSAVPKALIPEIRLKMTDMAMELHRLCESAEGEFKEVIQINMNMFPLSSEHSKK